MTRIAGWSIAVAALLAAHTAHAQSAPKSQSSSKPCAAKDRRGGEIVEAIAGFQQAGAASAPHTQDYFLDLFLSRPLPLPTTQNYSCIADDANSWFGPPWRLWGNVRVASYPQQVDTAVGQFATNFANNIASQPVNKLAQSAEFVVGLERRLWTFRNGLVGNDEAGRQRFVLSLFVGGGATGPLDPVESLRVFVTPAASSPQYAAFKAKYGDAVASSQYVGFVTPDRDKFFRQYSGGIRLTTFYEDITGKPYMAAPAMITFSLGQNEQVTGGTMRGVVGRFEAFYPLVLWGDRSTRGSGIVYLFGTAMLRLGGASQTTPFILQPADGVQGYDPGVAIVAAPSNRDTYLIGVGIDVGQLIKKPSLF